MRVLVPVLLAMMLLGSSAIADDYREKPTMTCKRLYARTLRCEATHVWPEIPKWTIWHVNESVCQHRGLVVYFHELPKVGELTMSFRGDTGRVTIGFKFRWVGDKVSFTKLEEDN